MGLQIDVGDGSSAAPDMIMLAVNPGVDTINVANNAASPSGVNVFVGGIDQAPTVVAAGSNLNVTTQAWLQAVSGVCTVKLTGGQYGL